MITKLFRLFSSLVAGAAMFVGSIGGGPVEKVKNLTSEPSLDGIIAREESPEFPLLEKSRGRLQGGDDLVRQGLTSAAVSAAELRPVEVLDGLEAGQSIAEIAEANGASTEKVLAVYDETVAYLFDRAVENGRLPQSLAEGRIAWYQAVGRLMIDQPGLEPAFPGLHQLHVAIIAAAIRAGEVDRWEVQAGLHDCQSLEAILAENGTDGQEAVDLAMGWASRLLDRGEQSGQLTAGQRQEWEASIQTAFEQMIATPGLHRAGKECAP
jgi:hypothetical protein